MKGMCPWCIQVPPGYPGASNGGIIFPEYPKLHWLFLEVKIHQEKKVAEKIYTVSTGSPFPRDSGCIIDEIEIPHGEESSKGPFFFSWKITDLAGWESPEWLSPERLLYYDPDPPRVTINDLKLHNAGEAAYVNGLVFVNEREILLGLQPEVCDLFPEGAEIWSICKNTDHGEMVLMNRSEHLETILEDLTVDGEYSLTLTGTDRAGNQTTSSPFCFIFDSSPPVITTEAFLNPEYLFSPGEWLQIPVSAEENNLIDSFTLRIGIGDEEPEALSSRLLGSRDGTIFYREVPGTIPF